MKDIKRSFAIISDTHVGSAFALLPPEYKTSYGYTVKGNSIQVAIYRFFEYFMTTVVKEFKVQEIIHLGDFIHGTNRKRVGENLTIPDIDEQVKCFCDILERFMQGKKLYIVGGGSDYHESMDTRIANTIQRALKAVNLGLFADIKVTNVNKVINVSHCIGVSYVYTATTLDSELKFQQCVEAEAKRGKVDILVRGHLHKFLHIHKPTIHGILVPCWQAFEPNKVSIVRSGLKIPDVGGVILYFDSKNRTVVHHFLYPEPKELMKLLTKSI